MVLSFALVLFSAPLALVVVVGARLAPKTVVVVKATLAPVALMVEGTELAMLVLVKVVVGVVPPSAYTRGCGYGSETYFRVSCQE